MRASYWWKVLANNKFQVDLSRLYIALGVSTFTPINDLLGVCQRALFGGKIARTEIEHAPLFIIGHWRSGTTLLHELLVTDERFAFPNTFQCFAPGSFLLTEPLMVRLGGFLLPRQRPMDNMKAGWQLPQEDEFALMNLGVPTPYLRIAFPRTQDEMLRYLSMNELSDEELERWRSAFEWFLKALTYHYSGRQLVLKSPTHTGRAGYLAAMFPNAKFIHLTRDPVKLYASTLRLWSSLESVQALQTSKSPEDMSGYVIDCFKVMYEQFERSRREIDPSNIVDLRYEDLAANPLETVSHIYDALNLGSFADVEQALRERLENHHEYQPNRHADNDSIRQTVLEHWTDYATRYGYAENPAAQRIAT